MSLRRKRQSPKPGVEFIGVGVAGVVLNSEGEIALLRRKRRAGKGLWGLPGGRAKIDESLADAILREVREELGVQSAIVRELGLFDDCGKDGHWVSGLYVLEILSGKPSNKEPYFHSELKWFSLSELPSDLMLVARSAIDRFRHVSSG